VVSATPLAEWGPPPLAPWPPYFFFFLKKYIFSFFKKINKLHDTWQDLIGPRVISLNQLMVNGRKNQFGPLLKPKGHFMIKIKPYRRKNKEVKPSG
jgi:hypothetical protein